MIEMIIPIDSETIKETTEIKGIQEIKEAKPQQINNKLDRLNK